MRYRDWTLGFFFAAVAMVCAPGCGGSDDEDTALAGSGGKKDAGTGGKKDGGTDASSGGTSGASGSAGASGSSGSSGASGVGGTAGTGNGGTAGTSSGGAAGGGGTKPDGGGGTANCPDPLNEPNETEAAATSVTAANECDAEQTEDGILKGKEVDWYKYAGTDPPLGCSPNPTAKTDQPALRVCVYASCTNGNTTVTCAQGTTSTSPAGRSGCCATGGEAEISLTCSNLLGTKDADIFMRVDQPTGDACLAYKLTYSN